jgi:hypothetical protein
VLWRTPQESEKVTHRMGEAICKSFSAKGLVPTIATGLLQFSDSKATRFIKGEGFEWMNIFQRRYTNANKHMKRQDTPLIFSLCHWEMQIKPTGRCHFMPARMARINKTVTVLVRTWRNWTLRHCWWDCKMVWPLRKTVWQSSKICVTQQFHC